MPRLKLPLEIVEISPASYHIFIECIVNDEKKEILVDTGASQTVFDLRFYQESIVPENVQMELLTSGIAPGAPDARPGKLRNFGFETCIWENIDALFMDLTHVNSLYQQFIPKDIAGLIGSDFLVKTRAELNYRKRLLIIDTPRKYPLRFW